MIKSLIDNINVFVRLSAAEEKTLAAHFTTKAFRKGELILQEGELCRHRYFIVTGVTRTYEVDEKGQVHVLQFGLENWWVADLRSFLKNTKSNYNIDCLEDTCVLQITKPDLDALYALVPCMERYFRIIIEHTFIATGKRISSTLTKNALERYLEFTKRFPELEIRVSNYLIASYLGITPQSLSRIRAQVASRQ